MIDKVMYRFDIKNICLKSKLEMNSYVSSIQRFEHIYEHASTRPIQFIKQKYELETQKSPHLSHHTKRFLENEQLNRKDVIKLLTDIKFREKGRRCVLRLMSAPETNSVSLADLESCNNVSCVTSDRVWVNDVEDLILTNRTGGTQHRLKVLHYDESKNGFHTVNNDSELIYIDEDDTIKKLSKDFKTTTQIIEKEDASLTPICLFFSLNTGDLLVGIHYTYSGKANVTRYNQNGQMTQTIQCGNICICIVIL